MISREREAGSTDRDERLMQSLEEVREVSRRLGLKPFDTRFEIVPPRIIYQLVAYGLPSGYSHWTHGKAYHQLKTMYDYGLSGFYELVINTDPTLAFLVSTNSLTENKMVAAHALAHSDFFRNNLGFAKTHRQMAEMAHLRADRIRKHEFEHGSREVEQFLDAVLTIQTNFDPFSMERPSPEQYVAQGRKEYLAAQGQKPPATPYDDLFSWGEPKKDKPREISVPFPPKEEQDLLWFIANFSPKGLEDWQKDSMDIVRKEAGYFYPQARTKIMNEGWATFWHCQIMRQLEEEGKLADNEGVSWAVLHAGVASRSPTRMNPYEVGWRMFEDSHRKYCGLPHPQGKKERDWRGEIIDPASFKGNPKYDIFRIRREVVSDEAFLRGFLTPNSVEDLGLYAYELRDGNWVVSEIEPEKVIEATINSCVNLGNPVINVAVGGGDYQGNQELYLVHKREGQNLDLVYADKTLCQIYSLWGRPVHLETKMEDGRHLLSCKDGKETTMTRL